MKIRSLGENIALTGAGGCAEGQIWITVSPLLANCRGYLHVPIQEAMAGHRRAIPASANPSRCTALLDVSHGSGRLRIPRKTSGRAGLDPVKPNPALVAPSRRRYGLRRAVVAAPERFLLRLFLHWLCFCFWRVEERSQEDLISRSFMHLTWVMWPAGHVGLTCLNHGLKNLEVPNTQFPRSL